MEIKTKETITALKDYGIISQPVKVKEKYLNQSTYPIQDLMDVYRKSGYDYDTLLRLFMHKRYMQDHIMVYFVDYLYNRYILLLGDDKLSEIDKELHKTLKQYRDKKVSKEDLIKITNKAQSQIRTKFWYPSYWLKLFLTTNGNIVFLMNNLVSLVPRTSEIERKKAFEVLRELIIAQNKS